MKRIFISLIALLLVPFIVSAEEINTSFDSKTCTLTVRGEQVGHEATAYLFNKEENPEGLKTNTIYNGAYEISFVLTYESNKTIDIAVSNELGQSVIHKYDVEIPSCKIVELANSKVLELFDDKGNSIVINDKDRAFNKTDYLQLEFYDEEGVKEFIESLKGTEQYEEIKRVFEFIIKNVGDYKQFAYYIDVFVRDKHNHDIDYSDYEKGFVLNLSLSKSDFEKLSGLRFAYVNDDFTLSDPIDYKYDEKAEIISFDINKPRAIVAYIDNDYNYLDETGNQTYSLKGGNTLTIRINAEFSKFIDVYFDGELLDPAKYDAKSGSTIITFKKDFMQSLSEGSHVIKVNFKDGSAVTNLEVVSKLNPKTEDIIMTYIVIILLSGMGISSVVLYFKKKH